MEITYDYYRIFYYVAKYGSFTKAAKMLGSSQPNITRSMNNLEAQLSVTLLHRTKKGVSLTSEGEKLFARVRIAFEQFSLAQQEMEDAKNLQDGSIAIGASEIALHEILLPVLAQFRKEYPRITIRITNESTPSAIESLREGQVDFAVVTTPLQDGAYYEYEEITDFREFAVTADETQIKEELTFQKLACLPLVMMAEGTGTRSFYEKVFEEHHAVLDPQMLASTADQILPMVRAGLGIGFVPESMLGAEGQIMKIRLKDEIPTRKICLVYMKGRGASVAAQEMMKRIRNAGKTAGAAVPE